MGQLRDCLATYPPLLLKGEGDKGGEVNKQSLIKLLAQPARACYNGANLFGW